MSRRLLVLDDNHEPRHALRTVLEEAKFEVMYAVDGDHALTKLARPPVIALIMEAAIEPHGLQNLRRILRLCPHLPVIVVTRSSSAELQAACEQLGVFAYLQKPVAAERLLAALSQIDLGPDDDTAAADATRGA